MEVLQINWEKALDDTIDEICRHVNIKTLCTVAKVSESWHKAALREVRKRCYIQKLHVPFVFGDHPLDTPISTLVDRLHVNPGVSVLIYNAALYASALRTASPIYDLNEKLLRDFEKKLPYKAIVLNVYGFLRTEDTTTVAMKETGKLDPSAKGGFLGLFFPSVKERTRVQMSCIQCYYGLKFEDAASDIVNELGLNDFDRSESTVLLFTYSYQGFRIADELIHKRFQQEKETVWVGVFEDHPLAATAYCGCYKSVHQNIVALRISGPSVRSWSAIIDVRSPSHEIEFQLEELNKQVERRRSCTGLIYATHRNKYASSGELMCKMEKIFEGIPFVGLFINRNWVSEIAIEGKEYKYFETE